MTTIRVSAPSVRAYGTQAQDIFGDIHTSLGQLVNDVTQVQYRGPNAATFKAKCGQMAADFANKMHTDIASMAEAVRASTSNIAGSLGGTPITITVEAKPFIVAPVEKSDGEETHVETSGLEALTPLVNHALQRDPRGSGEPPLGAAGDRLGRQRQGRCRDDGVRVHHDGADQLPDRRRTRSPPTSPTSSRACSLPTPRSSSSLPGSSG